MSLKEMVSHWEKSHSDNIQSLTDAISNTDSDFSFITIEQTQNKYEFLFTAGSDKYLLTFSMSLKKYYSEYKTYKIERNPAVFGSFNQRHLPDLDIRYSNASNVQFMFKKTQEINRSMERDTVVLLNNFGKDYLTVLVQYEEKD